MNRSMMIHITSRLITFSGLMMFLPIVVGLIYGEDFSSLSAFIKSIIIILLIFAYPAIKTPKDQSFYVKEGLLVTAISWILVSLFGGLPFYFTGATETLVDSFFEAASGFTTTGASVIPSLEGLSHSILFWRGFTHFIGGMGVLVLALAILPEMSSNALQLMKAEVPGPSFGKLLPRLKTTARTLYTIYSVMTIILIVALIFAGMPTFDAVVSGFSTAGTGGFAVHDSSIAHYNSPLIEVILSVGMLLFAINFNLFYGLIITKSFKVFKSEELKSFSIMVLVAIGIITVNISSMYDSLIYALKDSLFTVATIVSTTGFATIDFNLWPTTSKIIILLLMFAGGMAGSTAGGLKASRVLVLIKSAKNAVQKTLSPNRVLSVNYEYKPLEKSLENSINKYLIVYALMLGVLIFLVSFSGYDLETTISTSISCFNNVGPGMGALGPMENYYLVPQWTKLVLSLFMIAGRLELYPILILFLPRTWKEI